LRQSLSEQDVPGVVDDETGDAIDPGEINSRDDEDDNDQGDCGAA
jgi:hypothetical protein